MLRLVEGIKLNIMILSKISNFKISIKIVVRICDLILTYLKTLQIVRLAVWVKYLIEYNCSMVNCII